MSVGLIGIWDCVESSDMIISFSKVIVKAFHVCCSIYWICLIYRLESERMDLYVIYRNKVMG